tara:strand:+ start:226 stop:729 length:504 start_codon:yes stop_codon:yes gene_type:complete
VSEIKVDKLQGTSGSATAITLSGANTTVGGTLAVTGVHTVGNNAIYTSDAGGVTQNLVQGLAKSFILQENLGSFTTHDSFNVSSTNDYATGTIQPIFTNPFNNANYIATGGFASGIYNGSCMIPHASGNDDGYNHSTTDLYCYIRGNTNSGADDCERIPITIHGDLA